jgi:hypothetical protein
MAGLSDAADFDLQVAPSTVQTTGGGAGKFCGTDDA